MGRNSIHKLRGAPRHQKIRPVITLEDEVDLYRLVESETEPLLLVLEGVQDPHNLGACLRTASGAGATAIIAPAKGACGVTETVRDIACGGAEDVPFLQVPNLRMVIDRLKDRGMRFVGTSDRASGSLWECDLTGPCGLVLGSEGWGLRRMTADMCDDLVSLPMAGTVDCLNVSVSAGVCLYEAVRQRLSAAGPQPVDQA